MLAATQIHMARKLRRFKSILLGELNVLGNFLNNGPSANEYKVAGQHYVNHGEEDQMVCFFGVFWVAGEPLSVTISG